MQDLRILFSPSRRALHDKILVRLPLCDETAHAFFLRRPELDHFIPDVRGCGAWESWTLTLPLLRFRFRRTPTPLLETLQKRTLPAGHLPNVITYHPIHCNNKHVGVHP